MLFYFVFFLFFGCLGFFGDFEGGRGRDKLRVLGSFCAFRFFLVLRIFYFRCFVIECVGGKNEKLGWK